MLWHWTVAFCSWDKEIKTAHTRQDQTSRHRRCGLNSRSLPSILLPVMTEMIWMKPVNFPRSFEACSPFCLILSHPRGLNKRASCLSRLGEAVGAQRRQKQDKRILEAGLSAFIALETEARRGEGTLTGVHGQPPRRVACAVSGALCLVGPTFNLML